MSRRLNGCSENVSPGRVFRGRIGAPVFLVLAAALLLIPDQAWALQAHGAPEGLYVHQMAHIHFIIALAVLLRDLRRSSFSGSGWGLLQLFCVFMLLWNLVAFVGHAVAGYIHPSALVQVSDFLHGRLQGPLDGARIVFYLTKFDHFLAVPALFFLFLGMRTLYRSVLAESGEDT